ncbi:hypothetical protein HDU86_005338 [Geranomyces michiganensis]|nr:hypothetical protein HDU86_005338 [Geranomyces michiganensis]
MVHFFRNAGWVLRSSGMEILQERSTRQKPRQELAAVPKASLKHVLAFYEGQQAMFCGNLKLMIMQLEVRDKQMAHERELHAEKLARKDDAIRHLEAMLAAKDNVIAKQEQVAALTAIAHRYELADVRRGDTS